MANGFMKPPQPVDSAEPLTQEGWNLEFSALPVQNANRRTMKYSIVRETKITRIAALRSLTEKIDDIPLSAEVE